MYNMNTLWKPLLFAIEKHQGQIRKFNGQPYIMHPIRVAQIVQDHEGDESDIISALLHDTLEDTETTFEELECHFGSIVAQNVWQLTNESNVNKTEYLKHKLIDSPSHVLLIKLADRLDNVDDLSITHKSWSLNYATSTIQILSHLLEHRVSFTIQHLNLIEQIHERVDRFIQQLFQTHS